MKLPSVSIIKRRPLPQCSQPKKTLPAGPRRAQGERRAMELRGLDADCCPLSASWLIEGRAYCHRHAADFALRWLEQNQENDHG